MSTADTSRTDRHKIQAREPIGSAYQLSISNKMILSSLYWVMKWSYFFNLSKKTSYLSKA